jgi:hypothetical protein
VRRSQPARFLLETPTLAQCCHSNGWLTRHLNRRSGTGRPLKRGSFEFFDSSRERKLRCIRCCERQKNQPSLTKARKAIKAATRKRKAAAEQATNPDLDVSDTALAAEAETALRAFEAELRSAKEKFGLLALMAVSIFATSSGSPNQGVLKEGNISSITDRGYGIPAVAKRTKIAGVFKCLTAAERRDIGPAAVQVYGDDNFSQLYAEHVEKALQHHVETQLPGLKHLWTIAGQGSLRGKGPYQVGARFFPLNPDGTWPGIGYVFKSDEIEKGNGFKMASKK